MCIRAKVFSWPFSPTFSISIGLFKPLNELKVKITSRQFVSVSKGQISALNIKFFFILLKDPRFSALQGFNVSLNSNGRQTREVRGGVRRV